MTFRPTPFGIELAAHWQDIAEEGQRAVNVFHTVAPGPLPAPVPHAQLVDALSHFRTRYTNELVPLVSNQAHVTRWTARDISEEGAEVAEDLTVEIGGHVGPALPLGNAVVLTWRTARTGRSYRGRTYMPFVPQDYHSVTAPNTITDTALGLYRTGAENFRGGMAFDGSPLQVKSGQHNKVLLDPQVMTPITGRTVDNRIDHQNRRGRLP